MDVQERLQKMPLCKCGHREDDHWVTRQEMGDMLIHNQCSKCGCYGYEAGEKHDHSIQDRTR